MACGMVELDVKCSKETVDSLPGDDDALACWSEGLVTLDNQ